MRSDSYSNGIVGEDTFLRGACHALASLDSTGLTPAQTLTECQRLRAMHQRLTEGWPHADDAWWTTEAAAIIERLVHQRDEADAAQATLKAERDEARKECCSTWEAVMFRPATDIAADKGWDCFKALEETAREMYKGGD